MNGAAPFKSAFSSAIRALAPLLGAYNLKGIDARLLHTRRVIRGGWLIAIPLLCSCGPLQNLYIRNNGDQSKGGSAALLSGRADKGSGSVNSRDNIAIEGEIGSTAVTNTSKFPDLSGLSVSKGHLAPIRGLFVMGNIGDAEVVLSIDGTGRLLAWDVVNSTGYELGEIGLAPDVVAFDPQEQVVAAAEGGDLRLYDIRAGSTKRLRSTLTARVTSLSFEPNGRSLLIGAADGRIYRWRFSGRDLDGINEASTQLERYAGHAAVVSSVGYHPMGRVFFSGDWHGSLKAWLNYDADWYRGEFDRNFFGERFFGSEATSKRADRPGSQLISAIVATSDGRFIVVALEDGAIELWQVRGFKKVASVRGHRGLIYALAAAPQENTIVTSGRDGYVRVWTIKRVRRALEGADQYGLAAVEEFALTGISALALTSGERVFAGDSSGKVLEAVIREGPKEQHLNNL